MGAGSLGTNARGRGRSFRVNGSLLRSLRQAKGWTQQEAADKAGFSDRLIRKAEAGEAIDLQSIALLAQLYSSADTKLTLNGLLDEPLDASGPRSDARQIEAVVRRWYEEVWNNGRFDLIDEFVSPDCVLHAKGSELRGPAAIRERMEATRAAFRNLVLTVDQLAIEDNVAVVRWHAGFLHAGSWSGEAPTGETMEIYGSSWITVRVGLVEQIWQVIDGPHRLVRGDRCR
jgi:transcriptional regulator with XRE-family HTH domain